MPIPMPGASLSQPPTPEPDRPRGARWFARIIALDCECPHCGRVHQLGPGRSRTHHYDPRTGIFRCPYCRRGYCLGVIASRLPPSIAAIPDDWIPSVEQGLQLRSALSPSRVTNAVVPRRAPRNVLADGCRCKLYRLGSILVHPDCPVHSLAALGGDLDVT